MELIHLILTAKICKLQMDKCNVSLKFDENNDVNISMSFTTKFNK